MAVNVTFALKVAESCGCLQHKYVNHHAYFFNLLTARRFLSV